MRRSIILAAAVIIGFLPLIASAATIKGGDSVFFGSQDQAVEDMLMVGGGTVELSGVNNDDVLVGGGTVTVDGEVKGDLIIAGGTVKVSGPVAGSIHTIGGTIDLDGEVGRNILIAGGSVSLGKDSLVRGEVILGGGNATISGTIEKSLNGWVGNILLNGTVNGDVNLHTGDDCGDQVCVVVGPNTKISGNLRYWAAVEADIQTGAVIAGTTTRHPVKMIVPNYDVNNVFTIYRIWILFSSIVVGIVIALFLPRSLRGVAETMVQKWGRSVGFGLLILFATPMAILFLMLTVVGIPLALLLAAGYIIDLYLTQIFLGFFFGWVIVRSLRRGPGAPAETRWTLLLNVVVGLVALSMVFDFLLGPRFTNGMPIINFLGGVVRFALMVWAFGGLILYKFSVAKSQAA